MKLSLKTNLRIGLGISLFLLIISSTASYISIKNLIKSADLVVESNAIINDVDNVVSMLKDAETGQRGYLITGNPVFLEPYDRSIAKTDSLFVKLMTKTKDNAFEQQKLKELRVIIDKRMEILVSTIQTKKKLGNIQESILLEGKVYMDNARQIIREIRVEEKRWLQSRMADMNALSGYAPFLIILAAILSLLSTIFFYRKVSGEFNERVLLYQQLQQVNEDTSKRIDTIKSIAHQISTGNYKVRIQEHSKDGLGILSTSLNAMAEALQSSFTQLEDKDWMQTGIADLNDKMVGDKAITTLCSDILVAVAEHTKSAVGAFYIAENQQLQLVSGYALDIQEKKKKLMPGEGLVGQAFVSKKTIILEKIPKDENTISYASGQTKPNAIVAFPILRNGEALAVIELATLSNYSPRKLAFMENIVHGIGVALNAAQNRKKLQDLLEETQAQAEELQAQHSELEALNAELETQTQKIQASEEELRVQQEELLQSNQELEERSALLEERNQLILEKNLEIKQKAEQLEQSTRYKSEFLANMSHELRTPLNSILLLSKLMADSEQIEKEYTEYAAVIQSSGQGLLSLIDEILDLSKIEAGKMELEVAPVMVEEITTDMRSLFTPIAKDRHLELAIAVAGNAPNTFTTDKMRLSQILKNLLSNAFKFTQRGSVKLTIGYQQNQDMLSFTVSDTGIGIPKNKQGLIFEAFQQADGSTRRKFGGTGLGLSISKQLANLLGGNITLESKENEGSCFTLTIPANYHDKTKITTNEDTTTEPTQNSFPLENTPQHFVVEKIPDEIEDDRNHISAHDKTILIIEDDTFFAKTLLDFTRNRGYKGLVAVRGDQGVEMAHKYNPLAILLDIQLPVKDGWQVMDELKSDTQTKHIPVHVMSSLSAKRESLQKGAVDFINKPFAFEHMQQIFEKLEHSLNRQPKKALIVEENKQHALALSHFLSSANFETIVVPNIRESLEALQQNEIDCIILDMGIPDKSAYETLETIKKNKNLENLPIIIFTGKNLSKGEENRIKQYADSIIVKTAQSYQRILDEAALFLHLVEEKDNRNKAPEKTKTLQTITDVLKDKTVLIADDDVRNIFSLTKVLEAHKMKVLTATDGKEALNIIKEQPKIDTILMDMMMPEMDGYETTRQIRNIPAYKNLPILAVTAKAMMGDREKCIAAGASDYISKPVDFDQLISLLRVWLYAAP